MKSKPVSERTLIVSTTGAMVVGIVAGLFAAKWVLAKMFFKQ